MLVLEEAQLREIAVIDEAALNIVEQSFAWVADGNVDMPPIMHMSIPENNGDVDIKSAYVQGLDTLTVKLGSGFFNNPAKGLPSSSSTMVVMSTETGFCEAVLLENGYLTNLRTGMAGAVAAKYLARKDIDTVGIIGAGAQARFQLECLRLVRDFSKVRVFSRRQDQAQTYAVEMSKTLGVDVVVCETAEEVVKESQIIVTTTSSREPVIKAAWLQPGTHITAMGADVGGKQELAQECLERATLLVCDKASQCLSMGEFQARGSRLDTLAQSAIELGEYVAGTHYFEAAESDITICDLTGMGVQDTAIASLVMQKFRGE